MEQVITVVVATVVLLAVPGPTNVLLVATASCGTRRAIIPITAAIVRYVAPRTLLLLFALPLGITLIGFLVALRTLCGFYVVDTAFVVWRCGDVMARFSREVRLYDAFLIALFNPKVVVIATLVLPNELLGGHMPTALLLVASICAATSLGWVGAEALLRGRLGGQASGRRIRRAGAVALVGLGALLIVFTFLPA